MSKYLQGLPEFEIETNHKPQIPILNYRPLIEMSPRIQRFRMKLMAYRFTTTYIPRANIQDADAMSKSPVAALTVADELAEQEVTLHVNTIIKQLPATDE